MMSQEIIAGRLKNAMGLHVETVGMVTITNAIARRMRLHDIRSHDEYLAMLETTPGELQELIEAVIIPETWFFRDESPYHYIAGFVRQRIQDKGLLPVNILSIPCSTGEEPYSIAMVLDAANISPDLYRIEAVDISRPSLEKARTGHYRKNSFRSSNLAFVDRYFNKHDDYYEIRADIRGRINFRHGNILDNDFSRLQHAYDVVLCRNLLIYFDTETQARVFASLATILKANGRLILGHAETHHATECGFIPLGREHPYIFIKSENNEPGLRPSRDKRTPGIVCPRPLDRPDRPAYKPFADVTPRFPRHNEQEQDNRLSQAFAMANGGDTEAARALCLQLINDENGNADAYYLLGLLSDLAADRESAEQYLRKAIYLDPEHYEALVQLSILSTQNGNIETANRFKQRAERVMDRRDTGGAS